MSDRTMAEDMLITRSEWQRYVDANHFTAESIQSFADKEGIHPCIVLGRLHKEEKIPYGIHDKRFSLSYKVVMDD